MKSLLLGAAALAGFSFSATANADNIVEIAVANGSFNTLVAAVTAADLAGVLQSDGPFTVFAPTDEAFAALPEGTVASLLLPENKQQLIDILLLHVDDRKLTSNMLPHSAIHIRPINTSETLRVEKSGHGVTVDQANVVAADIMADNGVIHVIDAVLLPDGM